MRRQGGGPVRLPPFRPGMRIGLYGGSFDPPHPGHRHVALTALKRLRLDRVWWIATPGNPLKAVGPRATRADRLAAAARLARHPRMAVSDVEGELGLVYTVDTIRYLRRRCPGARLVWIMGADSLAGLQRWKSWREIARLVPLAVIDRPGWTFRAIVSPAATALAGWRIPEPDAGRLVDLQPPAWVFLHGVRSSASSTALREKS